MSIGYWEKKIIGLLHDPLDKILGKDHANFAKELADKLLKSSDTKDIILREIKEHHQQTAHHIRTADINASATNRGIIPDIEISEIVFQNPFSGYYISISDLLPLYNIERIVEIGRKSLETRLDKLNDQNKFEINKVGFLHLYRDLLPLYYLNHHEEISRLLLILPEDTRSPSSMNLSHLQMTSALMGAITCENKFDFYLVMLDIGGVQDLISQSRKVRDLWGASYLVSFLSAYAIRGLVEEFGPDCVLNPSILFAPMTNAIIFGKKDLKDIHLPVIPSTAVFLIPKTNPSEPASEVSPTYIENLLRKSLKSAWKKLVDAFLDNLEERLNVLNDKELEGIITKRRLIEELKNQAKKELMESKLFDEFFTKVRITIIDYKEIKDKNVIKNMSKLGGFEAFWIAYEKAQQIGKKDCFKYKPAELSNFGLYIDLLGRISHSKKHMLRFSHEPIQEHVKEFTCTICGYRIGLVEYVLSERLGINIKSDPGRKIYRKIKRRLLIDLGERLCAFDLLRRLLWDFFKKCIMPRSGERRQDRQRIPSVEDIAVNWFYATILSILIAYIEEKGLEKASSVIEKLLDKISGILNAVPSELYREREQVLNQLIIRLLNRLSDLIKGSEVSIDELKNLIEEIPPQVFFPEEFIKVMEREFISMGREIGEEGKRIIQEKLRESLKDFYEYLDNLLKDKPKIILRAKKVLLSEIANIIGLPENILKEFLLLANPLIKDKKEENLFELAKKANIFDRDKDLIIPIALRPIDRYVLLRADGDDMGEWITGKRFPPYILLHHPDIIPKHIECAKDISELRSVLIRARPISPAILSSFSSTLVINAILMSKIIEALGGFVIYSGGDDILALLPPETWFLAYLLTRSLFSREISLLYCLNGFEDGIYTYGLGWRATISYGIIVADTKADLSMVVKESRELEEKSKGRIYYDKEQGMKRVKDAVTVSLWSRAGPIRTARALQNVLLKSPEADKFLPIRIIDEAMLNFQYKDLSQIEKIAKKYINVYINEFIKKIREDETDKSKIVYIGLSPAKAYYPIMDSLLLMVLYKRNVVSRRFLYTLEEYRMKKEIPQELLLYEMKYYLERRLAIKESSETIRKLREKLLDYFIRRFKQADDEQLSEIWSLTLILDESLQNCKI